MGRTHAFDGWPRTATPGLREAWTAQRNDAGKTRDAMLSLHCCKPGFAIPGEPAGRMRPAPVFHAPKHVPALWRRRWEWRARRVQPAAPRSTTSITMVRTDSPVT